MEGPLVSILMPAYNAEQYIGKAIESILHQTYTNFELLLLDDASSDSTFRIINSFKDTRIKVYQNPKNLGYLKSCNFLFQQAKGDLITFQDADDWSYPSRIEKQFKKFMDDADLGLCATGSRTEVTIDGVTRDSVQGVSTDEEIKRYLIDTNSLPFTCATIMVKDKVLQQVGPYRAFFDRIGAEHVDWAYMICEKFKSALIEEVLYFYTFNPGSFTKTQSMSIKKRKSLALAKFFHLQRIATGSDDLQNGTTWGIDNFIAELETPYVVDQSLFLRESALDYLNKRIYRAACSQAWQSIKMAPTRASSWKVCSIVLSRSFIGILRFAFKKVKNMEPNRSHFK